MNELLGIPKHKNFGYWQLHLLHQTDSSLPANYRGYGCYVRSEKAGAEFLLSRGKANKKILNPIQIKLLDDYSISKKWVTDKRRILGGHEGKILQATHQLFGSGRKIIFVNSLPGDSVKPIKDCQFAIFKFDTKIGDGNHFMAGICWPELQIFFNPDPRFHDDKTLLKLDRVFLFQYQ